MTDVELIEFAFELREGILSGRASNGACAAVCWPLGSLLNMQGVECEYVETDLGDLNHVWLKLADGRALDPTLDQFNHLFAEKFPAVYLGSPTKYHGAAPSSLAGDRNG